MGNHFPQSIVMWPCKRLQSWEMVNQFSSSSNKNSKKKKKKKDRGPLEKAVLQEEKGLR
jgi:hypothetical protein